MQCRHRFINLLNTVTETAHILILSDDTKSTSLPAMLNMIDLNRKILKGIQALMEEWERRKWVLVTLSVTMPRRHKLYVS